MPDPGNEPDSAAGGRLPLTWAQTVASQRLPFRTSGPRYRVRLLAGTYSINAVSAGGSAGDTLYVPQS
jgi:hypothetical protein